MNANTTAKSQCIPHAPLALPPPTSAPAPATPLGAAPRTIVIQRPDARHGFGFTLRHLVVYPPDSLQDLYEDARHLAVGAVGAPMDTIFVRSVRPGGPAAAAGLRAGDRVLAVNGEPVACGRSRAPYARVVQLAQREPRILRLTVVPRDHDLLQRYFSEAAYNPETNQRPIDMPAPISEHESRLFDAYQRPRAALPAPQAPARHREDPEYATVAGLAPSRFDARLGASHYLLQDSRRESDTSLPSSAAESKDSLGSFDSNSTLTGRELDDSIILSRIRKSLEQKEAFLRRPSQPTGWVTPEAPAPIKQKEFYARPQKLQKPAWPPPASSPPLAASPPPTQDLKKDECSASVDSGTYSGYGEVNGTHTDRSRIKQDKSQFVSTLSKIQETGPSIQSTNVGTVTNGDQESKDISGNQDNRYPIPELQLVTARTRQLEEARGGGERRTEVARSELARLTTTRLEPSVALRRKEFETRTTRREARSLDVQPQHDLDNETPLGGSLSGNQLMITGSKHLHCPPPDGYVPETEKVQMRTRSNSTGSEGLPIRRQHASVLESSENAENAADDSCVTKRRRTKTKVIRDDSHLVLDDSLSDGDTIPGGDTIQNQSTITENTLLVEIRELRAQITLQAQKQEARDGEICDTIKILQTCLLNITNQNTTLEKEIKLLRQNTEDNAKRIHELENENLKLKHELKKSYPVEINDANNAVSNDNYTCLKGKPNLKEEAHKKIIVLYGLNETRYETEYELQERILNIFYDITGIDLSGYLEDLSRIGGRGTRRPLKIELLSKKVTKYIMECKRCFKNTGLWVSEYLDESGLQQRKQERENFRKAKQYKHTTTLEKSPSLTNAKINNQTQPVTNKHRKYNNSFRH